MPFNERTRNFWRKVTDDKCAYEQYTERQGFKDCGKPAEHVHHIRGEADQIIHGEDPEHSVGLPLCQKHHVRNESDVLGEPNASFHPDIGGAYKSYREWKSQQEHMNSITGKKSIDYSTSPFSETAQDHQERAKRGERYISGDDGTDEYYTDKMRTAAVRFLAEHPDEEKPDTSPHPKAGKKKKWYDFLG